RQYRARRRKALQGPRSDPDHRPLQLRPLRQAARQGSGRRARACRDPPIAFAIAGLYWSTNGLNEKADAEDFLGITKRINGGTNGLADRERYYRRAREILADGFVSGARRGGLRAPRVPREVEPLLRGYEAIAEFDP